jgi:hypothetical protein
VNLLKRFSVLLLLTSSPREASISSRIQCPASFGNRVFKIERNAPNLPLFFASRRTKQISKILLLRTSVNYMQTSLK